MRNRGNSVGGQFVAKRATCLWCPGCPSNRKSEFTPVIVMPKVPFDPSIAIKFDEAAEAVKSLTKRPTDEELLELYALYKQATIGDVNTSRPGMFDMKGRAKWDFWEKKKGMSKTDAMEKYIEYVNNLLAKYK